ncbi:multidrug efflux SMR transporter [Paenibacillus sp. FJAT-26967]|uniref:DMT family transporter n=1 Tax=Paenibacillus sp. FJAT-26967 TaxID=1729690 RepID=UPI000A6BFFC4|nr:SMR family transporter [Paenibacillus sp. FJAT-26967]
MEAVKSRRVGFSFIYHLIIFALAHVLLIFVIGVVPASDLTEGSYVDHLSRHFWNRGVDIYLNDPVNKMSQVWKTVLIIHGVIDLSYLLFPSKKNNDKTTNKPVQVDNLSGMQHTLEVPLAAVPVKKQEKPPISNRRGWTYVLVAGALEIVWASSLKYDYVPSILVLAALLLSFDLLIRAVKIIPIGTVYGVFTGIGTVGLVIMEAMMEGYIRPLKVGIILLLLVFIILLKQTSGRKENS